MAYPDTTKLQELLNDLKRFADLKHEQGATGLGSILGEARRSLARAVSAVKKRPADSAQARREPTDLEAIRDLRPKGPRRMWRQIDTEGYAERLRGALLGRLAGCTLGAPVEGRSLREMRHQAEAVGDPFPPTDYWRRVPDPLAERIGGFPVQRFTREGMDGVPPDDDIAYTLLGLLILEEAGPDFTTAEVARAWQRYVPKAFTAEQVALENLRQGIPPEKAGQVDGAIQQHGAHLPDRQAAIRDHRPAEALHPPGAPDRRRLMPPAPSAAAHLDTLPALAVRASRVRCLPTRVE